MEQLMIEWKHLDVEGETCDRCKETGKNLKDEVDRLNSELNPKGIELILKETRLDESALEESNAILLNGILIEEVVDIQVVENYCASCSELVEGDAYCRAVVYQGKEYEEVPLNAIRDASYQILGLKAEETPFQMA